MRPINLVLAIALPLASLKAQTTAPDSRNRVRIHFTDARTSRVVTGTLVFQDADSVTLREEVRAGPVDGSSRVGPPAVRGTEERRISVSRSQVTRMEVSTGRHSRVGRGALIGAGVGVVGGAVLGVANLCSTNESFLCFESPGQVVAVAAGTGLIGAGIGAILGVFIHHENWVTAGEGPRASVLLRPSEKGAAMGLAITF